MGIPRPGMRNRFHRFRCLRDLHLCLRCCALGPDLTKPMDKEADLRDIRLRLTPDHPHLFSLLDRPLLQPTSQTMLARSIFRGNIHLPSLVAGTAPRIPLPVSATRLLCLHIHRRGSPSSSTTLTFPTRSRRATQDHPFSHHPTFVSILHRKTRRPGIHLGAETITARPSRFHSKRFRAILVVQASHQYRRNSLPQLSIRRIRHLRLIRPRSPRSLHLSQDTHLHHLLTHHQLSRDILFIRRHSFQHISRRTPVITSARTRRMGTPLPLQDLAIGLSLDVRARSRNYQILL